MNSNNTLSIWNNELGRFFDDFWTSTPASQTWRAVESAWHPACDVEEGEDHFLLTLDMPGVQKDEIKLEVMDNQLLISGERKQEAKKKTDGAWYSERRFGKFHRTFSLPPGVDAEKVQASYQDGMLRIAIPKAASAKPRQIKIGNETNPGFFARLTGQSSKEKEAS
jgi:HSP20 family protein